MEKRRIAAGFGVAAAMTLIAGVMFACAPQGTTSVPAADTGSSAPEGLTVDEKDGTKRPVSSSTAPTIRPLRCTAAASMRPWGSTAQIAIWSP